MPDELAQTSTAPKASSNSSADPRHRRRQILMQQLFAATFQAGTPAQQNFTTEHPDLTALLAELPELDEKIRVAAPERPLSEINKVDLAILRLIMFEWKTSQTPVKVLIDEGIELAKEFGTDSSPRFINGVLAQLLTR
jgi:transcription antitermination protein NusB